MMQEFSYKNSMQVPRLTKITLNVGLGEATQNVKVVDTAVAEITLITGQKPVVTRAKKAIANFKLREGVPIGCMVTLRRERMFEFLDRLIHVALAARARLQRHLRSLLRRPGQLLPRPARADYFSRDSRRQGRKDPRDDDHDRDHGEDGREGRALLKFMGMPFAS